MTASAALPAPPPPAVGQPRGSPLELEVARLRQLQHGGGHAAALASVRASLVDFPENRDLLLIEASALRHLTRTYEALASLDRLAALHPGYSLMHQERGLCHVARKDAPAAIAALLAAVNINPALPISWRMLEGVYRLVGDGYNAATAAGHAATLRQLPPEVINATSLFADGELVLAEVITRRFLLTRGDHPEAMRLLARIGVAQGVLDDAETLYAGVLTLAPGHDAARLEYVQTLIARHKYAQARSALAPLLASDPVNTAYRTEATAAAVGLGEHDQAIALYRELLAEYAARQSDEPSARAAGADVNLWLGHALKTVGQLPEAIAAYHAAAAFRPDFGEAWWSLANLKTYRFAADEIVTMREAEGAAETQAANRVQLNFALAKALEDSGDFADAWGCYIRGNALQREASRYRPEILETNTAEQKRVCTNAFFADREGWGDPSPDPIFIVGLPRSGSTLIEQILASHPTVEGTQELPDIQRIVLELQGRDPDLDNPRYPAALADLSPAACRELGAVYLASTRIHRKAGRRLFIDKMPNNFRHIGLIQLILPQATIIDARRGALACCVSNLKQLFAQGQEFSYSAVDIARYYRTYLELMRHWDSALPGKVLRVCNEDVIADLEGQVRRILSHCRLDFDAACMAFHENKRAVRTPSSEQVRRPISSEGIAQWRHFEPWLGPLKDALGPAAEEWTVGGWRA
jgi:tetratricopeptide (TPR) repeat protein